MIAPKTPTLHTAFANDEGEVEILLNAKNIARLAEQALERGDETVSVYYYPRVIRKVVEQAEEVMAENSEY